MSALMAMAVTALAIATVALLAVAIRHSRRQAARLDKALVEALRAQLGTRLVLTEDTLSLEGGSSALPRARVLAACRGKSTPEAVARAASALLKQPLEALSGPLSLKIHGPRIHLHLVRPQVLELAGTRPRLARQPIVDLGLVATYRVDGDSRQCVSEDHLAAQSIDTRDLHGIALAVLRQAFDEQVVVDALAGRPRTLESSDGRAAAALLVLPDFLPAGSRLAGSLAGPDRLTLEPWTDPQPAAGETLRLVIDPSGYQIL